VELESKQATVEAKAVDDAEGIVQAVVSVTNIVDNVKDVIEPGAYDNTLQKRVPKGVWSHDTTVPVARTVMAEELRPGDDRLPDHLKAQDAGGVLVKMQFNLNTSRGRDAYEDIKFFGGEQEWSIGYSVPEGGSEMKGDTGIRHIKTLDWYEYSPVLFGAAPGTKTVSVKEEMVHTETQEMDVEDVKGPIRSHKTGIRDEGWYDKTAYKNMRSPADKAYFSKIFAFHIDGEDPTMKTNYTFVHHFVGSDGRPGPAALSALQNTFGLLNGARNGTKLRGSDRKGVYNHIAKHYRDDGRTPPELKADEYIDAVMEMKERLPESVNEDIDALIEKGAELFEIKSNLEDIMANDAEITETTDAEIVAEDAPVSVQSVLNDAITALNTLSERLGDLEEKAGDTPGFSNTDPDSDERVEGAGEDAPEVVENLSHGGTNTPEEMEVEGTPAGNSDKPAKKPAAKKPAAEEAPAEEDAEKADSEAITEENIEDAGEAKEAPNGVLDSLDLAELREFQDLVTYSDLGE
jgi:HK97 family phage prohead protease